MKTEGPILPPGYAKDYILYVYFGVKRINRYYML